MTDTLYPRLRALVGPAGPELTCEECFEMLDAFVDAELAGDHAERAVPGMRAHLEGCPACHEDYESLLALIETTQMAEPGIASI